MRSERGRCAVGKALLDAHLRIQAAVVTSTKDVIGHIQRQKIGIGAAYGDSADANLGLHGVGLVDQPDVGGRAARRNLRWSGGDIKFRPAAKIFFSDREGFVGRDVPRKTEYGLIRRVVRVVKFHEIFALQFFYRGWGALFRQAVGRISVERARERQRRQIIRVGVLHFQVGEKL